MQFLHDIRAKKTTTECGEKIKGEKTYGWRSIVNILNDMEYCVRFLFMVSSVLNSGLFNIIIIIIILRL